MAYQFDVYDYLVLTFVLLISIAIGLYHAFAQKLGRLFRKIFKRGEAEVNVENKNEMSEYLTANGSLTALPIAFSLLASIFSATSLLGLPAEVYQYGVEYFVEIFGIIIAPIVGAFVTGPMFARLKIVSIFEYFKIRYNSDSIRLVATSVYIIRSFIQTGIVIFGPATTITALTPINTPVAVIIIGAVATLYTTIGGIKAVIWTDLFQMIIMFVGVTAVIIKGTIDVGGLDEVWKINERGGRINFFDFNPNPFIRQSFWTITIGMFFYFFGPYCLDQQMLQRYQAAKSRRHAQTALLLNIPGIILLIGLCCLSGLVTYANYANCDPLSAPKITNVLDPNQLIIFLVTDKMKIIKGFTGLFVSSVISGSLSSVSSALNSMAAIIWEDYFKKFNYFRNLNDSKSTFIVKILVVITGFISTGVGIVIAGIGGNLIQISSSLNGAMGSPITGLFLLAGLFPFSNIWGGIAGIMSGLGFGLWLSFGSFLIKPQYPKLTVNSDCYSNLTTAFHTNTTVAALFETTTRHSMTLGKEALNLNGFNNFYSVSYSLYSFVGAFVTVAVGVIVSLLTCGHRQKPKHDNVMLIKCLNNKNAIKQETDAVDVEDLGIVRF